MSTVLFVTALCALGLIAGRFFTAVIVATKCKRDEDRHAADCIGGSYCTCGYAEEHADA
jgi:hypothetical protein